ncbi:hypothetical protein BT96DRAFT_1101478 [Gymnopus androsaceus JB14]|uniref:DUF6534 domain-containing protein n=1 Tax=Gymnopus androsaceus JB14 TaxID=1447944 RepID=A0A6A4HRR9_9AGAR|nr:hypothetical protein BT96DRAFT_1101478 [Gymnopus androsaceus JB14]
MTNEDDGADKKQDVKIKYINCETVKKNVKFQFHFVLIIVDRTLPSLRSVSGTILIGAASAFAILGYQDHATEFSLNPDLLEFALAFRVSTASGIAFDTILTITLTSSLYRARSGIKKSNHIINLIVIATVNTNLITILLSLAQLITFMTLPSTEYWSAIVFVLPKSYMNCFLATLNYRDYLQKKLNTDNNTANWVSLETMRAHPGNNSQHDSTPNTMSLRDGIEVHIKTKPADIMAV